jgi:hypothetical protein
MPRELTEAEKKVLVQWVASVPWLQAYFDHNLSVIPRFFESHPNMPVTPETLSLAVQSTELLPDPYQPNALDRLRIGEIVAPTTPRPWSAPSRAPEPEKPKLMNNALLPSHGRRQQSLPDWYKPATAESVAELKSLREAVRKLRTLETRDNLPVTGSER